MKKQTFRTDKEKTVQILVRVPPYLKEEFKEVLTLEDENQSEVIRKFIKSYIAEKRAKIKSQPSLF